MGVGGGDEVDGLGGGVGVQVAFEAGETHLAGVVEWWWVGG